MTELPELLLEIILVYICFLIYSLTPGTFGVVVDRLLNTSERGIINSICSETFRQTLRISSVFEQLVS